jgi:succinyl-diaminopimelate desuccinylase
MSALATAVRLEEKNTLRRLASLVRLPTVNPPGAGYLECAEYLRGQMEQLGLATRVHRVPTAEARRLGAEAVAHPRANVIGRWDVGAPRTVHFNCHFDVVPAGPGWRFGAFEPKVSKGWMYGRGTADMKGAISSVLTAVAALRRERIQPRVNVEVSFTADEETNSALGAAWIIRKGLVEADVAIVCEGGSEDKIGVGHNGVLWFEVRVLGKSAHGSEPQRGVNAVEKMAALVLELQRQSKRLGRRTFEAPDGSKRHPTINLGGVVATDGGAKINTVPGSVTFTIDRRVLPNEDLRTAETELLGWIRDAEGRIPGLQTEVVKLSENASSFIEPADPLPQAFAKALRSARRSPVRFMVSTGFNDSQFFTREAGLPTIAYGPGGVDYHAVDERVRIRDLNVAAEAYARFLTSWEG